MITVLDPGPFASVQDLGRPGLGHLGIPRAGAADPPSMTLANRLVGNAAGAATLEFLQGGFTIRFEEAVSFALTGAPVACRLSSPLASRPVALNAWCRAGAGEVLTAERPVSGMRTYLALAGGVAGEPTFDSRSTDSLSGLGPPRLSAGDVLRVGPASSLPAAFPDAVPGLQRTERLTATFSWGPREDWFTPEARRLLTTVPWKVSADTDRVAARLTGPTLQYVSNRQLPSEGLHLGSIQVPPVGQPIVHLANHPPSGGYPVIGVVRRRDVALISQARPGADLQLISSDSPLA